MPLTHLVFDLDGTISDPAVGIHRCFNHALSSFGYAPLAKEAVSTCIGPPLDVSFARITGSRSAEHIAALVEKYRERYAETGYAENVIYPGIPDVLEGLLGQDARLGICTSKRVDFAEQILDMFGIREYFEFVSGGEIGVAKEQQLRDLVLAGVTTARSTMIGDRAIDIHAARANGLRAAGVLWGHGSLAELEAARPDLLLDEPMQLLDLASRP